MLHEIRAVVECVQGCLLPLEASSWHESDVPLGQRGVRFSWLYDFVAKVWENLDAFIAAEWAKYHSVEKAAMYGPWDIPEPELPAYSRHMIENLQTTRQFVSNLIAPLTRPISAPLYARVPPEHRGVPSVFVSHTWSSTALAQAHGSLDIVLDHYRDAFVWIDIACYNQHTVKKREYRCRHEGGNRRNRPHSIRPNDRAFLHKKLVHVGNCLWSSDTRRRGSA